MKVRISPSLIIIVVLLQCVCITFFFAFVKEGVHSDEIWNYAFANSYYTKELTFSDEGEYLFNCWLSAERFHEYLTVEPNHRFSYDAVISNVSKDLNPPFQYFILHTICSFFPGVFSWWFCYLINISAFIISQIYLYKTVKLITDNDVVSLAAVLLYGFGVGAMNITIFMRIYALGVMFVVLFTYYSLKIFKQKDSNCISVWNYVKLFLVCFFGAYTIHLFYLVAFCITLSYSLYYLFSKRFKLFIIHGFTCLAAVLFAILLFPSTFFRNISNSGAHTYDRVKYPFGMQLRYYFYLITRDLFGMHISAFPNPYLEWFIIGLLCLIVFIIPIWFVFRKELFVKELIVRIKYWIVSTILKVKYFHYEFISLGVPVFILIIIAAEKTSVYGMGGYSSRYIFLVYPLAILFSSCSVYYILCLFMSNKRVVNTLVFILCAIFSLWTHYVAHNDDYLFIHEKEGVTADEFEKESNTILVLGSDWHVVCFAPDLMYTNAYYATNFWILNDISNIYDSIDKNNPCYIIVEQTNIIPGNVDYSKVKENPFWEKADGYMFHEQDLLKYFYDRNVKSIQYIGKDNKMKGEYKIYRIYFKPEISL